MGGALETLGGAIVQLVGPDRLLGLALVYLRVQAFLLVFPVMSERVVPVRVRVAVALALTPVFAAFAPDLAGAGAMTPVAIATAATVESAVGLLLALPVRIMVWSLGIAATAIGATASLAQIIGTGTEAAPHPIGAFLHLAGLALLVTLGLPQMMLGLIADGYALFPVLELPAAGDVVGTVVALVVRSFLLAMMIASPFILGGLLFQSLSGVVNKVMPALPVVFIGAPAAILLALVGLALLAAPILGLWSQAILSGQFWR